MLNRHALAALVLVLGCRGREEYPRDVADRFLASCLAKRPPGQVQLALFSDYCRCTLDRVQARFSYGEFQALERRMLDDGGEVPDELASIAAACREKMIAK